MNRYHVHFTKEKDGFEFPPLKLWHNVRGENHRDAAINALKKRVPFPGTLRTWVHGEKDPKYENGKPMAVHCFDVVCDNTL